MFHAYEQIAFLYHTHSIQPFRISKWYARDTRSVSAGVYAQYQFARLGIIVIFVIELLHYPISLLQIFEGVQYFKFRR